MSQRDVATLASLLRRYGKAKTLSGGRRVHAYICQSGNDHNIFIANCLVELYGNCGKVEDARVVFDRIAIPNVYSWNILMKTYSRNESLANACAVFDKIPNPDSCSWNILIQAYSQTGNLEAVSSLFYRMPRRTVVSWTAVIMAHAQNGHGKEALHIFRHMQLEGVEPNKITFVCVLEACVCMEDLAEGQEIHAAIVVKGYEQDDMVGTSLVDMYGKCRSLSNAMNVFGGMPRQDLVTWTAMMVAYVNNGQAMEALKLFRQMELECIRPDEVSFVCAVDACAHIEALKEGKKIHSGILAYGYEQGALGNALINMYGKCGNLQGARVVFGRMPHKDTASWNALITALVHNECGTETLEMFCQMQLENVEPDRITFVCVLDACANMAALEEGQEIHAATVNSGNETDVLVGTAIINLYGKCGILNSARSVFEKMPCRDVISWNTMIAAFAQNGNCEGALDMLCEMQIEGVKPDEITFLCTLDACVSLKALAVGNEIHSAIIKNEYEHDLALGNILINMYSKCGCLCDAKRVFGRMHNRNIVSWNAMITGLVQNGCDDEALDLFNKMSCEGIIPEKVSFVCALDACCSVAALEKGQEIHSAIITLGYEQDVANSLLDLYGKCGSLNNAKSMFEKAPHEDTVLWNSMMAAFAQNGHGKEALDLFHKMLLEGIRPDKITFTCILTACSRTGQVDDGSRLFLSMSKDYGIPHNEDHYACLVDLLARAGHLDEAEDLINNMPLERVAARWACLLGACRIHGDVDRGIRAANFCFESDPMNVVPYVILSNIYAMASRWDGVANVREAMRNAM